MRHFVRVYTAFKVNISIDKNTFFKIITTFVYTKVYPKFIVLNQKEETVNIERLKTQKNC